MMNTETENSIFLSHAAAVHQMLLKGESQTRDLLFIGGARLHTLEDRIGIAQMVQLNDADVLHFGFEHTANGYELTELSVCMRRDGMIALARECRLWSDRSGERVILVPPADRFKGSFGFLPDEIMHLRSRPRNPDAGFARADATPRTLVAAGAREDKHGAGRNEQKEPAEA